MLVASNTDMLWLDQAHHSELSLVLFFELTLSIGHARVIPGTLVTGQLLQLQKWPVLAMGQHIEFKAADLGKQGPVESNHDFKVLGFKVQVLGSVGACRKICHLLIGCDFEFVEGVPGQEAFNDVGNDDTANEEGKELAGAWGDLSVPFDVEPDLLRVEVFAKESFYASFLYRWLVLFLFSVASTHLF